MPRKTRQAHAVRLRFEADSLVHTNLSGAVFTRDWLWVAGDEAAGLTRLAPQPAAADQPPTWGEAQDFPLADLLDLPGAADEEADLEGLCLDGGQIWLVGSHGRKRKKPKPEASDADNARRLGKTALDANRCLLACVPLEWDAEGRPQLRRKAADGLNARSLQGDAKGNALTDLLAEDPLLAPFLRIPGKDNGLDIEGLVVQDGRVIVGLRGPVLRGWSLLLEFAVVPKGEHGLKLAPLDAAGTLLRKHALALDGLGVRDLHFDGEDLLILAGPTMVLDGDVRLFRWCGARAQMAAAQQAVQFVHSSPALLRELDLPHRRGTDRAEALCAMTGDPNAWLVLYDAPGPQRQPLPGLVYGDLLRIGS